MEIIRRTTYRQPFVLDPEGDARRLPDRDRFVEIVSVLDADGTRHEALLRWLGEGDKPADPTDWTAAIADASAANLRELVDGFAKVADASRCSCTGKHLVSRAPVWTSGGCAFCGHRPVQGSWVIRALAVPDDDSTELVVRQVTDDGLAASGPQFDFADLETELHRIATMDGEALALITDEASSLVVDPRATPLDVVRAAGDALAHAREQLALATAAAKTAVRYASAQGVGPSALADAADVTRMTIRDWLGQ